MMITWIPSAYEWNLPPHPPLLPPPLPHPTLCHPINADVEQWQEGFAFLFRSSVELTRIRDGGNCRVRPTSHFCHVPISLCLIIWTCNCKVSLTSLRWRDINPFTAVMSLVKTTNCMSGLHWLFQDVCMFACALLLALDRLVYACFMYWFRCPFLLWIVKCFEPV